MASNNTSLAVGILLLAVFAVVVNPLIAYGKLRWFYCCSQCGARAPRVLESQAGSAIRYWCVACNVEWDTDWEETDADESYCTALRAG